MPGYPGGAIGLNWMKSSFSHGNGNCVEVAGLSTELIRIRDSKNVNGPVLAFTPAEWDAFLGGIRNGELDHHLGTNS
jgi:hypothetical protein